MFAVPKQALEVTAQESRKPVPGGLYLNGSWTEELLAQDEVERLFTH